MNYLFFFCIIFSSIVSITVEGKESHRELPAFALNNFKDSVLTWANIRDNSNAGPVRSPGFTGLHGGNSASEMEFNALSEDSFALYVDGVSYVDGKNFGGDAWIQTDGMFYYEPYAYSNNSDVFGDSLKFQRITAFPEGMHAYTVIYKFQNLKKDNAMNISLLDYVLSGEGPNSSVECNSEGNCTYRIPISASGSWKVSTFISSVPKDVQKTFTAANASDGSKKPLAQFTAKQQLDNNDKFGPASQVAFGVALSGIIVPAGETVEIAFVRSFVFPGGKEGENKNHDELMTICKTKTKEWLKRGVYQTNEFTSYIKAKRDEFYPIALLSMRMSQNPVVGTFAASFHAAYQFKTWARDAVFSAMIMDTAGYHENAELFLKWLHNAERREEDGGFHTCYSWWTGASVGFVEPQFDSAGAALMAYYYHYKYTHGTQLLNDAKELIHSLEDFFMQNYSGGAFVKPDYSIWEESSDGRTGKGIDPSHFTFTHSLAYAGILSASFIERDVFGDNDRADAALERSKQFAYTLDKYFWHEDENSTGFYVRGLIANNLTQDLRMDGSTAATVFSGACSNKTRADLHIQSIIKRITKLDAGIARYENDPFFYDSIYSPGGREVGEASPPWGVVTMFTAWAEINAYSLTGSGIIVRKRLDWMAEHLYPNLMPVGESVDGISGEPVMSSSPDLYEHAGVFVWSYLLYHNKVVLPNPAYW